MSTLEDVRAIVAGLVAGEEVAHGADVVRLRIEADEFPSWPEDLPECDGEVVYGRNSTCTGHTVRPSRFDGAARIVERDDRGAWWWQPSADVPEENRAETLRYMRERFHDGWSVVVVELVRTCDMGYEHVVDSAALGCVDDTGAAYLAELLPDLVGEVLAGGQ